MDRTIRRYTKKTSFDKISIHIFYIDITNISIVCNYIKYFFYFSFHFRFFFLEYTDIKYVYKCTIHEMKNNCNT